METRAEWHVLWEQTRCSLISRSIQNNVDRKCARSIARIGGNYNIQCTLCTLCDMKRVSFEWYLYWKTVISSSKRTIIDNENGGNTRTRLIRNVAPEWSRRESIDDTTDIRLRKVKANVKNQIEILKKKIIIMFSSSISTRADKSKRGKRTPAYPFG